MMSDTVWTILVMEAGALESQRSEFKAHWPACGEFRFQGFLGFGGKVWFDRFGHRVYVNCYPEDATLERREVIDRVNAALFNVVPSIRRGW